MCINIMKYICGRPEYDFPHCHQPTNIAEHVWLQSLFICYRCQVLLTSYIYFTTVATAEDVQSFKNT